MRWGHCPASYSSGTPRLSGRSPSWPLRPFVIQPLTPAASSAPFSTVLLEGSPCSLRVLSCVQALPSPCLNAFSYSVPRPSRSCCLRGGSSDYPVQFVCVSFFSALHLPLGGEGGGRGVLCVIHWDVYPTTHTGAGTERMLQSCQMEGEVTYWGRNEGHSLWPSQHWGAKPEAGACEAGVSWALSSRINPAEGPM